MSETIMERLEKLTGPDRGLDRAIHEATNPPLRPGYRYGHVPEYTASIDSAVSLVERVLGECSWRVFRDYGGYVDGYIYYFPTKEGGPVRVTEQGSTPAIALLLALFSARALAQGE